MNVNEHFIHESEQIIRENTIVGQYYIIYCDITDFNTVNHFYGKDSGDAILKEMERLFSGCHGILLCHRIFADLFLCLLQLENEIEIEGFLNNLDVKMHSFLIEQQSKYPACWLKAACGVSRIENGKVAQAIDDANAARKLSKKQLSSKTVLYNCIIKDKAIARHESERKIYNAIRENRFCFYLQPKVNLANGEIVGAEALARRIEENGEVVYPDKFMELMENSGAVIELDRIICRQVCMFLSERIRKNLPVLCISVNLSRLHIQNPDTANELHAIAQEYDIRPQLLEFELTETILLEEFTGAKRLIDQLRAYGYRVSIDDFGSGYAGINIWQELDFDCLKLDRKFLSDNRHLKQRNEVIVPNVINIAQRLHVQVLCEGVEAEEQCSYLLRLGCTLAQGFYFSRPLPPEQMFQMYEEKNRSFALPRALQPDAVKEDTNKSNSKRSPGHRHVKAYLLTIILCALFLGICIMGTLTINRNLTRREFMQMVTETLNAYTNGQRENTLKEIDGVTSTLQSLAVLIRKNDSRDFIDASLLALNEEGTEVRYTYYSNNDYQAMLEQGEVREKDKEAMERLEKGEIVVTDITRSERLGNIYCIGIGVPVIRDGEFIGAVRGIIDAGALISTELYDPAQGEVTAVFLTDADSTILPVRDVNGRGVGDRLLKRLENYGLDNETLDELYAAFSSGDAKARSIRVGTYGGSPYYLSITGLKYNGWHLVVCLKADQALEHFQYITHYTAYNIAGLLLALSLASLILICLGRRVQRKISLDEQRYLLLEHFSDTVIFDYDYRRDTIRFTSNAAKLLRVHELVQSGFLNHLDQVYVYAGDQEEVRKMLDGRAGSTDGGKIRVRLLRPGTDEYFWCLVQYQYLYEKGALASVIGKITDIDEHMRHEDYLLHLSETDGLTGLLNKTAAEKMVAERLESGKKGMLFIMDVDGFKQVNDKYGHAAGDLALQFLGEALRKTFRENDILGRIGGDELLVFTEGIDKIDTARKKAESLEKYLKSRAETGIPPYTVSIGIAKFPLHGRNYQELFYAADHAMYAAKKKGKGMCCIFEGNSEVS